MEELKRRLIERGTDSIEVIERRLAIAKEEAKEIGFYDYVVVNDDLDTATKEVKDIILKEMDKYDKE